MNTRIVILAAGKGKRMGAEVPKVLLPISGRPMIDHLLASVRAAGVDQKPVVVVGHGANLIQEHLGESCDYAFQTEPLGTGHALRCALPLLDGAEHVLVLYGDHALVSAETIKNLAIFCSSKNSPVSLMTVKLEDFEDWRKSFWDFGRVVRGVNGLVERIVEKRDALMDELEIKEVNPGYYCFRLDWLKENIDKITNQNAQNEFYLTDLVGLAIKQGLPVEAIPVKDPREGLGVNTREQLEVAEVLAVE